MFVFLLCQNQTSKLLTPPDSSDMGDTKHVANGELIEETN